jgi:hypothetical protein
LGELGAVILELDDDLGAAALTFAFLDFVAAGAVARPDVAGLGRAPGVAEDLHALCDHERGIETHAELPDEIGVLLSALTEGFQELLRAGMRDRAEVLHELVARHADAEVLNRNGLRLVVGRDVDLELETVVEDLLFRELGVAQLLERVGGVGHQLADEDFLLRVERVDDDIEQLLDLGLELEFLRSGGGHEWR